MTTLAVWLIAKLSRRVQVLHAVTCLLLALVRVTGCRLEGERLPDGEAKGQMLKAIGKVTKTIALWSALKVIGLSKARYHAWQRVDESTQCVGDRGQSTDGNIGGLPAHADEYSVTVCTASGQGLHAGPRSEWSEEHAQRAVNRKAKTDGAGKSSKTN